MHDALQQLIEQVQAARRIVAFTGAGISTESGIPDFRGPGGVWEKFDPADFHIDRFLANEASRRRYWQRSSAMYEQILQARPNAAHHALAALEQQGRLGALITQNVDGLHQLAGNAPERIIELHGNTRAVACMACGHRVPREAFQPRVTPEGDAPPCDQCGGLMKPATISFGQMLTPESLQRAADESDACDLFLVIGSSLVVYPAAAFPLRALQAGAALVIVNNQETPHDRYASLVIQASAGEVMSGLLDGLRMRGAPVPLPS